MGKMPIMLWGKTHDLYFLIIGFDVSNLCIMIYDYG